MQVEGLRWAVTMSMRQCIINRNYAGIRSKLRTAGVSNSGTELHAANRGYNLDYNTENSARFTALEWAFYKGDTKMATIFWMHGADPKWNIFEGVLYSERRVNGFAGENWRCVLEGFDAANPRPIEGYAGLNLLIKESDLASKALVWLMDQLDSGYISLQNDYRKLLECFDRLENDLDYSPADFERYVKTSLLAIRRMGLPNDTALSIVESALVSHRRLLLESYAKAARLPPPALHARTLRSRATPVRAWRALRG
ncbi:hypothetical protein ACHAWF_013828 [Thalassiosira exigua]